MAADARTYEGHSYIFGMDGDMDPSVLEPTILSKAVNRTFRGGKNRTRPPFVHRQFVFSNADDEYIVRYGNVQGVVSYQKTQAGRLDSLVASIAGSIFRFTLVNQKFNVERLTSGNNAKLMHAWFCQASDWLYIQNGLDKPIFWNGILGGTLRRSDWPDKIEMPVGTLMTYAFGRVFVADAYDQVAASDIIYGTGFTNTSNTQNFTENQYWTEGGSFGMPANLGSITGMIATSSQSKGNLFGQGYVMVLGREGAQAIDAGSVTRLAWKDAQIQSIAMTGMGCLAPGSVININNRTLFRSDDGLALFQNLQLDQANQLAFAKFSQATNNWFDKDTPWLVRYNYTIHAHNRLLSTVGPVCEPASDDAFGSHRYHRGVVSLDLDRSAEKLTGQALQWEGLWTGIRPTALVNGRFDGVKRAFAFSFDADGENRIYELMAQGMNDELNGSPVKTKWFYTGKRFDWATAGSSNVFEMKKIVGGELHISEAGDRISVAVDYRSDNRPDWRTLMKPTAFGPQMSGFEFTARRWSRFKFLTPTDACPPGELNPPASGLQHQFMVSGEGSVRVDRMRVSMSPGGNDPNIPIGNDPTKIDNPSTKIGIDGKFENDYEYLIAPPKP